MLLTKVEFSYPKRVEMGQSLPLNAQIRSYLPIPPVHWHYRVTEGYCGTVQKYNENAKIYAKHCGCLHIQVKKAWKYDYLGLFRIPVLGRKTQDVLVIPKPIPIRSLPGLKRYMCGRWKAKPGGGFAENYDLREYRPADDLRLIHWKLAAKTQKLVIREPIVPIRGRLILTMLLRGDADALDEKLGKLLYLSAFLLSKELPHELHCLTGDGLREYKISSQSELDKTVHSLLCAPLTQEAQMPCAKAAWQYRIGGEHDEA